MNIKSIIAAGLFAVALIGCGGEPEVVYDRTDIEEFKDISRENANKNLRSFANSEYPDAFKYSIQSDSTVSMKCPLGDGFASGVMETDKGQISVKCSTVGSGMGISGCMLADDFMAKSAYSEQEGRCDSSITELPKL